MNLGLFILGLLATIISIFLMFLILIQRGKGGGLTGALGGMGGQSAFGSKAGDLFTRITVITAIIWMTCCLLIIKVYNYPPASAVVTDPSGEVTGTDEGAGAGAGISSEGEFQKDIDNPESTSDNDKDTTPDSTDDPELNGGETTDGDGAANKEDEENPTITPENGNTENGGTNESEDPENGDDSNNDASTDSDND